jgi:hypothetical protein
MAVLGYTDTYIVGYKKTRALTSILSLERTPFSVSGSGKDVCGTSSKFSILCWTMFPFFLSFLVGKFG